MFGISVFLGADFNARTFDYLKDMHRIGFRGIFSSLHIPEEDASLYSRRLQQLGSAAKELDLDLMVDISGKALGKLGLSFENLSPLKEWGVTGLRMDDGIEEKMIAAASRELTVALNASTVTPIQVKSLQQLGADFSRLEAWHNYYPRPETGLERTFFLQKNQWLKQAGFCIAAFVPGDELKRGPLHQGLPTLEDHRFCLPLAAALDLKQHLLVDDVYIGDPSLSVSSRDQFEHYLLEDVLLLHASPAPVADWNRAAGCHQNRPDAARDVIRSAGSRLSPSVAPVPAHTVPRPRGTITVDNVLYGRYAGEIQISKKDLAADEKVNVLGKVVASDLPLLNYCGSKQKFKIQFEGV